MHLILGSQLSPANEAAAAAPTVAAGQAPAEEDDGVVDLTKPSSFLGGGGYGK